MNRKIYQFVTRSLRNKLLCSLVLIHLLTISGVAWYFYCSYDSLIETLKDEQLRTLADAYATNQQIPELRSVDITKIEKKETFIVQIWDKEGRIQASSWPQLAIPLNAKPGLYTVSTGPRSNQRWRVYTRAGAKNSQIGMIQVIHNIRYIQKLILRRAISDVIPLVMLLPFSFGVLWWGVRRVSVNLKNVSYFIASQETDDFSQDYMNRIPDEIVPMVDAYHSVLDRLSNAISIQRRFLQDSAHELRTPITAISLQLENLRPYMISDEARERFMQLESGVLRTRNLVGQLLSLSRQEGDNAALKTVETIDLNQLLKESIEHLMVLADSRRIDIGFTGYEGLTIRGNHSELRSLFDNLIGNAMRHTPEGTVVDVVLKKVAASTVIEIIDNGPGIPEENIQHAFDRFSRFNTTEIHGSGLGLAIVKSIATSHGLNVELRNLYHGRDIVGFCVSVTSLSA
ncbi:sensor histidine kinase [Enterobacter cloacae complex sp. CARB60]|uniref:sensor histidine kinase n=1 Tax=Enterobacter cloacae complex sp. CARB60 TaxID=3119569 RepID=UPI002F426654